MGVEGSEHSFLCFSCFLGISGEVCGDRGGGMKTSFSLSFPFSFFLSHFPLSGLLFWLRGSFDRPLFWGCSWGALAALTVSFVFGVFLGSARSRVSSGLGVVGISLRVSSRFLSVNFFFPFIFPFFFSSSFSMRWRILEKIGERIILSFVSGAVATRSCVGALFLMSEEKEKNKVIFSKKFIFLFFFFCSLLKRTFSFFLYLVPRHTYVSTVGDHSAFVRWKVLSLGKERRVAFRAASGLPPVWKDFRSRGLPRIPLAFVCWKGFPGSRFIPRMGKGRKQRDASGLRSLEGLFEPVWEEEKVNKCFERFRTI